MTGFVKLVAAARFVHGGRRLFPGERFQASEPEAADLVAIRFAMRAKEDDAVVGVSAQAPRSEAFGRETQDEVDAPVRVVRRKRRKWSKEAA